MASVPIEFRNDTDKKSYEIFQNAFNRIPNVDDNDIVYHYTSPEGLMGITASQSLWATDMNYLNDSSEQRHIFCLAKSLVGDNKDKWNAGFCESLLNQCIQKIEKYDIKNRLLFVDKTDAYVVSFSLDPDNLNMWKYYTKTANSIGYNIGFRKKELVSISELEYWTYGKVIYSEIEQKTILSDTLLKFEELYASQPDSFGKAQVFQILMATLNNLAVFFKHPAFSDEQEFRLIIYNHQRLNKKDSIEIKYRVKDGIFVPYTLLSFLPEAVKSIGISPSEKQQMAEYSVERMLEGKYNLQCSDYHCSKIPFIP